jgi:hypothetical protein
VDVEGILVLYRILMQFVGKCVRIYAGGLFCLEKSSRARELRPTIKLAS